MSGLPWGVWALAMVSTVLAGDLPPGVDPGDPALRQGCLDVTKPPYEADPTGVKDSTEAIQRAVNDARDHRFACYFPEGTYLLSDTLSCEQMVRRLESPRFVEGGKRADYWHLDHQIVMIGSTKGRSRPILKLSPCAGGFDDPSNPKVFVKIWAHTWYGDGTGEQPNISFNHIFRGIDIDIRGHGGAIGIRHSGSQGSTLQDSRILAEGAYGGMSNCCGQGGGTHNVEVLGGQFGIVIEPGSRFPLLNACAFRGQTKAAIRYAQGGSQVPTLLVGCVMEAQGGCVVDNTTERSYAGISMVDCVVDMKPPGVLCKTVKDENIFLENCYLRGVQRVSGGGPEAPSPAEWTRVGLYSWHAAQGVNLLDGVEGTGGVVEWRKAESEPSVAAFRDRHYFAGPSFEDADAVNVKDLGAAGDGATDDTKAFEKAIAGHDKIFMPPGDYRLSGALRLRERTHLFSFNRAWTSIGAAGGRGARGAAGQEAGEFTISTPDDANASPGISFLSVRGRVDWASGRGSYMLSSGALSITGHGGGKFCGVMAMGRPFELQGTREPISFYALNVERVLSNPQSSIKDCQNVRVYYFKVEAGTLDRANANDGNTVCRVSDSRDVRIYCMYGNVRKLGSRPMLEVADSDAILVSQLKAFQPSTFPHLQESHGGATFEIPSSRIVSLFLRGLKSFDD